MDEQARRAMPPKRVRYPAGCSFASGCSPPRLATTQLPSATCVTTSHRLDFHLPDKTTSRTHSSPRKRGSRAAGAEDRRERQRPWTPACAGVTCRGSSRLDCPACELPSLRAAPGLARGAALEGLQKSSERFQSLQIPSTIPSETCNSLPKIAIPGADFGLIKGLRGIEPEKKFTIDISLPGRPA